MDFISVQDGLIKCLRETLNDATKMPAPTPRITAYFDGVTHEKTSLKCFETFKKKIKYILLRYVCFK